MFRKTLSMLMLSAVLITNIGQTAVYAIEPEEPVKEATEEIVEEKKEEDKDTSIKKDEENEEQETVNELKEPEGPTKEQTKEIEEESEENGSVEESFTEHELAEEVNGYSISAYGRMPKNAELNVTVIENSDDIENIINEKISEDVTYHVYAAFDINILVNNEKWQPVDFDELVKIKVTGIETKESITYSPGEAIEEISEEAVYRVENEDVTELESVVADDEVTFDTEHFTIFTVGGVSYNTNNGTCVFDTSKTYTLYSRVTSTELTTDFTIYPAVKIYWFEDTKTLYWDLVDSNPTSKPVVKTAYGIGYGTEGNTNAFQVEDYQAETLVFSEGFKSVMKDSSDDYKNCPTIKKVVLSSTIEDIADKCFEDCSALETVDMSKVTTDFTVGVSAFRNCTSLTSCVLPQTTKIIYHGAFNGCSNLETIGEGLPPHLELLGSLVFSDCGKLKLKTTLPDTLKYLQSFKGANGLRSENVEVTGTLPANLQKFKCVWSNAGVHFAYLNTVKLRGDIPAGVDEIGNTMFSTFENQPIESQSYFTRNLSSVEITAENRIPVKYVIEDRVGDESGTLLGSNEYLGFVGLETNISSHMTKWNDTETIKYAGYSVKDNTATVTPVLDSAGSVAKAVRIWEPSEKYFYLKVFRNGVAKELGKPLTLVDSSSSHPLTLTAEYVDNGIYKVGFDPSALTVSDYNYNLEVYIGDDKARDLYNRRLFKGSYSEEPAVSLSTVGYWYEACYFSHRDKATGNYTYNLDVITNAKKMSEIDLSDISSIDFEDTTDAGYMINFFTEKTALFPKEDIYYYVDYQDWAFLADANTGEYSDGSDKKYVQFYGEDTKGIYTNGLPEEPTKEGYEFADWESTKNKVILQDWYNAGQSSEDVTKYLYNPYRGNTHIINLSSIEGHLYDLAYLHYTSDKPDTCNNMTHVSTRYAKYRPIITFNANGGQFEDGSETVKKTTRNTQSYFNYVDRPTNPTREGHNFKGYSPSNSFINSNSAFSDADNTPQVYTAVWEAKNILIGFEQSGGSYVPYQTIKWGGKAVKPSDPTKNGYSFMGWYTDSTYTTPVDWENDTYKENTVLYPLYKEKPFVKFNTNGGSAVASEYVEYMGKLVKPENPVKDGYTFSKWYKDENLTEEYDFNTVLTEDLTLYAGYEANTYTITYDYDGGSVEEANRTSYEPTDASFVLNNASKKHYVFRGYTVENDETDGFRITNPQGNLTIPKGTYGNLSVKAEYSEKAMHTVTFDLGYEGSTPFTVKVYDGEALETPEDPKREGYFFKCWMNQYGTELFKISDYVYGDLYYTAVWIKSYAITFDADGGTFDDGTSFVTLYTDKDGHVSSIPSPKKPAYEYTGAWYSDSDQSTGVKYDLTTDFSMWNSDKTLYAQYARLIFTINYVLDGGTTESTLYTGYDGSKEVIIPDDIVKDGYHFTGWTIENDGYDGATYSVDEPRKGIVIPKDVFGNLTIKAHYKKQYDVTLNANGGQFKDGSDKNTVRSDENGKIKIEEEPEREGYIFKGWEKDNTKFDIDTDVIGEDTELKATWELKKVVISFYDGEKEIEKKTYNYGDEVTAPGVSREGYIFTGWNPTFVGIAKNDTTYKANYRAKTYRVRFIDYNGYIISDKTYSYGTNIDIPEEPKRTGYRFKGYSPEISTVCMKDAEYRAIYEEIKEPEVKTYLITFAGYNGQIVSSTSYKEGENITIPNAPTVDGYNFRNWYPTVEAKATKSVTYTAVYDAKPVKIEDPKTKPEKKKEKEEEKIEEKEPEEKPSENEKPDEIPKKERFTVVFKDSDGEIISRKVYEDGDEIVIPKAPKKEGYTFEGWSPKISDKALKDVEYKTIYKAVNEEKEPEKKEEKKPVKVSPVVKSLVAGAACVGILTAGYFSGVWLLLLNVLFIGKRKKWRGILSEEENRYVKQVRNLDDEECEIKALLEDSEGDVNAFLDSVSLLKSYTVLPLGTKMFITLSDKKGSDVRSFDKADEDMFYDILAENLSQDMRVVLNLVNERCNVDIEIEFGITRKEKDISAYQPNAVNTEKKPDLDEDLVFLDEEDLPDYA